MNSKLQKLLPEHFALPSARDLPHPVFQTSLRVWLSYQTCTSQRLTGKVPYSSIFLSLGLSQALSIEHNNLLNK